MTAANLAVIFGPNLLQRERGGDGMGIEDSTAIIGVTLLLVQNHRRLFTVAAHKTMSINIAETSTLILNDLQSSLLSI